MQSLKWCVMRLYFGCREPVPCGRTAVLVTSLFQKHRELHGTGIPSKWYCSAAVLRVPHNSNPQRQRSCIVNAALQAEKSNGCAE